MTGMDLQQPQPLPGEKNYHCGTLTYTKVGMFTIFGWLLWGDFCFMLMETVVPTILPLHLKALGASNTLMSVIMTVLPSILNMTVCPWVSARSDRHRGRFGRRIPFIVSTMPFLAICLVMLGWGREIAGLLQQTIPALASTTPATVTIAVLATFLVLFQLFNMFVNSVFWYLFNDVVPPQFLGRFMGLFRMVGTVAAFLYNEFVLQYGMTNMREIFTGAAVLYVVGFGIMCLCLREGKYPPPPPEEKVGGDGDDEDSREPRDGHTAPFAPPARSFWMTVSGLGRSLVPRQVQVFAKTFGKQSFSTKFYWYFYLMNAFAAMAGSWGMFSVFFSFQMGLTLKDIGELAAWGSVAGFAATYFTSIFVDRWHPLRISTYIAVFTAVTGLSSWVWVFVTLPGNVYFWISLLGSLVGVFAACLQDACGMPLFMRLMPKSLYGQFCSANSITRAFARIFSGILVGLFMDGLVRLCVNSGYHGDFAYRLLFVWPWFFNVISCVFIVKGYREWKRLGGDENYRPPAPWTKEGFEDVIDKVKSVPAKPRSVMLSMWMMLIGSIVNLLLTGVFMFFMAQHGLTEAFNWYVWYFIPFKLVLIGMNVVQQVQVKRDVVAYEQGRPTKMGVPHHGVLLVNAIKGLMAFPVFWYQTDVMIKMDLGYELIIFGIASLISTFMSLMVVHILRWIERTPKEPVGTSREVLAAQPAEVG